MKKSLLFILASLIAIFALTGCADEPAKEEGNKPLPAELQEYLGTYTVTFFGSQVTNATGSLASMAEMFYISNDCKKAEELYPTIVNKNGKNNCNESQKQQSTLLVGQVVIKDDNGKLLITSKMEMQGGAVDHSSEDKYQYTVYYPTSSLSGEGVKGWNYDEKNNKPSATSTEFPESPFTIKKESDGTYRLDMTLVGKKVMSGAVTLDAKNTILLKKESNTPTELKNEVTKLQPKPASR